MDALKQYILSAFADNDEWAYTFENEYGDFEPFSTPYPLSFDIPKEYMGIVQSTNDIALQIKQWIFDEIQQKIGEQIQELDISYDKHDSKMYKDDSIEFQVHKIIATISFMVLAIYKDDEFDDEVE